MKEHNYIAKALDLSFYKDAPDLSAKAELTIEALAPLSMVSSQPGTYFRSELAPTRHMVLGMLENALGWHFHGALRQELRKGLAKVAKKGAGRNTPFKDSAWLKGNLSSSGSKYESLLDHHVELSLKQAPKTLGYDDLWSMLNRRDDDTFDTGSRNYSFELEDYVSAFNSSKANNKKGGKEQKLDWDKKKIRPFFPQYYYSPTKRAYIIPRGEYIYDLKSTSILIESIESALLEPIGPLYLGTNDGWVDAKLKVL